MLCRTNLSLSVGAACRVFGKEMDLEEFLKSVKRWFSISMQRKPEEDSANEEEEEDGSTGGGKDGKLGDL